MHKGEKYLAHGNIYVSESRLPGIRVVPVFQNLESANGFVYVTQLCHSHEQIRIANGTKYEFPDFGYPLADGKCDNHVGIFKLSLGKSNLYWNDKISGESMPFFIDSPNLPIGELLEYLRYKIEFETIFQFSEGDIPHQNIKKLASFKWDLDIELTKTNGEWTIKNLSPCSIEGISQSVVYYPDREEGIDPRNFRELGRVVDHYKKTGRY